ncbi:MULTISPECIES: hypothetical protein [Streptomyces]|uniref:hypothetical protein n=1 Tax=Streptomyces TaxID=1883 RepID=UPI000F781689|nr:MULTISPECIES: hypothetical protein [Streptomyces]RST06193.1 hypothetical protein EF910_10735 [Streptomyces sp. WAC07149]GLX17860.1 hypothetical protein Slala01_15040 [Streptomyces lavendulae subsp. lavendulae]GLX26204.1 hypothetical protein Slala02_20240 [Streptomyces lavendulae subsp. lavendulae]
MSSPAARLAPRPVRLYDSWWTVAAGALCALVVLAAGLWCSLHMQADAAMHSAALFAHLASLVLGFGAVLSADYYGLLWATGRCGLAEVVAATSRLHVPIWAGLGGLVVSGLMLHPDLTSTLTLTKIGLVALLTVNGLQAGLLGRRLEAATGEVGRGLLVWGGATALVSQACWWGAVVIGFLNTNR